MAFVLSERLTALSCLLGLGRGAAALPNALVAAQVRAARGGYPVTFAATMIAGVMVVLSSDRSGDVLACAAALFLVSLLALRHWFADPASPRRSPTARRRPRSVPPICALAPKVRRARPKQP